MDNQEKFETYKSGVVDGIKHQTPSPETIKFMENINLEIKFIKEALEELKIIAKQQANDLICLPDKIIIKTDERYATKIELERMRSRVNWYAWLTPIATLVIGLLISRIW